MVKFEASRLEFKFANRIARRAAYELGVDYGQIEMDLIACHLNGCQLDFERLLTADEFNFAHDIFGISGHIDRGTGKLRDCFVPRFASEQHTYEPESRPCRDCDGKGYYGGDGHSDDTQDCGSCGGCGSVPA